MVKSYLLHGLKSIYLIFNYCGPDFKSKVYGCTKSMGITVNVNYMPIDLSLEEYRKGPLKPYIALIIYH
jgi:hypothetical protein